MELLGRLAQSGVVLLNEVPANFILGKVVVGGAVGIDVGRGLELVLLGERSVGSHFIKWYVRYAMDREKLWS